MSIANISQLGDCSQVENDKYYDLILFVSELSPKNDFSFHYSDGYVSFENLSYDCIKFFLNRFKNFDIFPLNLYSFKENRYKFHFDVNSIYEKFNNKIKVELPINKCSGRTLEMLNCFQFLIDIFRGLNYIIIYRENDIELSDLDQQSMQAFVNKMREIQLKPKKINFSSKFLFQLVFDVDDLVKFIEEDSKLLELYDSKIIREPFKKIGETSHYESALSTDEFPTSVESANGEKITANKYLQITEEPMEHNEYVAPIEAVYKTSNRKTTIGFPRKMPKRRSAPAKTAEDKYAMSNIDNDSLKSDPKSIMKKRGKREIICTNLDKLDNSKHGKRSERLRNKYIFSENLMKKRTTEMMKMPTVRVVLNKSIANVTDIDSIPFDSVPNLSSITFDKAKKLDSLDSTIQSVLRQNDEQDECSFKELVKNPEDFIPIKEEAAVVAIPENNGDDSLRLIFSSYSNSTGLIYNSKGVKGPHMDKRKKSTGKIVKKNVLI